ncbi:MAG: 5'-nucleotidase C-terminal domain-containing protein, partial [Pseudomonadota bacterium]
QEGADLIVALSHSGIEHNVHTNTREHASLSLAAVDGIDVIITGHSHQVFPSHDFEGIPNVDATAGLLHGKPATMAGFGGSHVGVVDLSLQQGASGWSVNMATAKSLPVPRSNRMASQAERKILAITKDAHERTLNYIRKAVGRTNQPLDSHFAMLQPASSVRFVATAQHQFLRKKLLDTQHAALPFLSAAAPFKMGGRGGPDNFADVPAGDIAIRNVADLYGYPNMIRALAVDTTQLLDWLEFSACIFNQIEPGGTDQPLIDPTFPSYNFDSICGLSYEIDISKPARFTKSGEIKNPDAQRISNVTWNGTPVDRSQIFVVATNDYRASRSGTYPGADAGELVFSAPEALQDILVKFLQETKPSRSLMPPPWALAPCSGASVYFDTSVKALESATALVLGAVPQGQTDHGFMRFRKVL